MDEKAYFLGKVTWKSVTSESFLDSDSLSQGGWTPLEGRVVVWEFGGRRIRGEGGDGASDGEDDDDDNDDDYDDGNQYNDIDGYEDND